jgi:hypothetical protein
MDCIEDGLDKSEIGCVLLTSCCTDEPVAEIVQDGEPILQVLAAIETVNKFAE